MAYLKNPVVIIFFLIIALLVSVTLLGLFVSDEEESVSYSLSQGDFLIVPLDIPYGGHLGYRIVSEVPIDVFLMDNTDYSYSYYIDFCRDWYGFYRPSDPAILGPISIFNEGNLPYDYIDEGSFINVLNASSEAYLSEGEYFLIVDNTNIGTLPSVESKYTIAEVSISLKRAEAFRIDALFQGLTPAIFVLTFLGVGLTAVGYLGYERAHSAFIEIKDVLSKSKSGVSLLLSMIGGLMILYTVVFGVTAQLLPVADAKTAHALVFISGLLICFLSIARFEWPEHEVYLGRGILIACAVCLLLGGGLYLSNEVNLVIVWIFLAVIGGLLGDTSRNPQST